MDITGKIIWAGDKRSGMSQTGNSWASQDFVVESRFNTPTGEMVQRLAFNVFGEDKLNEANIHVGDEVEIGYGVNAREYNGRWYNDVRAYKVSNLTSKRNNASIVQNMQHQQNVAQRAQEIFESGGMPVEVQTPF